jgi:hypothetical protein
MNWFRENRWLGTFVIVLAIVTLVALYFLFRAKGAFEEASARFNNAAAERNRLDHLNPFPSEANYRKMKGYLADYGAALNKLEEELKTQMLPVTPFAPNEFQSRLRRAMIETAAKARANRVKLPENFRLGFDEFTTALPNTAAAPLLGQELAQVELLMNFVIDAHVDALTALKRTPLPEERSATPAATPGRKPAGQAATGPKMLERGIVDLTFTSSPSAARKVLNQIASTSQQFYIIRAVHVRNEHEKGPPREAAEAGGAAAPKSTPSAVIKFIVGNEHIETSARIEIVRFTF